MRINLFLLGAMFSTTALWAQNVGIGQATPVSKLHVTANGAATDGVQITTSNTGNLAADGVKIGIVSGTTDAFMYQQEDATLRLGTNAAEVMRINKASGTDATSSAANTKQVLIGSTYPTFAVTGGASFPATMTGFSSYTIPTFGGAGATFTDARLQVVSGGTDIGIYSEYNGAAGGRSFFGLSNGTRSAMWVQNTSTGAAASFQGASVAGASSAVSIAKDINTGITTGTALGRVLQVTQSHPQNTTPAFTVFNASIPVIDVATMANDATNTAGASADILFVNNLGTGSGTGYGGASGHFGILSQVIGTASYSFGIAGSAPGGGTGFRYAGSIGTMTNAGYPSCYLAYKASSGIYYGSYTNPNGNTGVGTGTGRFANNHNNTNGLPTIEAATIAYAGYGTLMGGWLRGDVYGVLAKGNRYSMYVDGKTYTNAPIAQLSEVAGSTERVATYVPTSTEITINTQGKGALKAGVSTVAFGNTFAGLAGDDIIVTITPIGDCNGVHLVEVTPNGFTVKENQKGTSNVRFNWMATAVRRDATNNTIATELLSKDFDATMNDVMFNEGNTKASGKPMWWDGTKVRFDAVPQMINGEGGDAEMKKLEPEDQKRSADKR